MAAHDRQPLGSGHLPLSDIRPQMAKASLPDIRKADIDGWRARVGLVVARVKGERSLKEFADLIDRDERQVKRWIEGTDRPQFDALFAVKALRVPLVVALAELAEDARVETVITVRKECA